MAPFILIAGFAPDKLLIWREPTHRVTQNSLRTRCLHNLPSTRIGGVGPPLGCYSAHCSLTPCESRFINEGRLASHDETRNKGEDELMDRLEESVATAESDLKLLREILGWMSYDAVADLMAARRSSISSRSTSQ
jgi:hypothetical protein